MAAEMAQRVMYERRASRELVIDSSVNIFTNSFHLMQMTSDSLLSHNVQLLATKWSRFSNGRLISFEY